MTQTEKLTRAEALLLKSGLKATPVYNRTTGALVGYKVLAREASERAGYAVYHIVRWNDRRWNCECKFGKKPGNVCVHKLAAHKADQAARRAAASEANVAYLESIA